VRNKNKNRLETFTKVGSGFTDKDFKEIGKRLVKAEKKPVNLFVDEDMEPDEYVELEMVIEVLGAEITTSPKHTAGRKKSKKGYALRFPRFLHIREDKDPDQATTVEEIEKLKQAEQKRN
jgi:DNA ligase-1